MRIGSICRHILIEILHDWHYYSEFLLASLAEYSHRTEIVSFKLPHIGSN
jgi:hypothetical protein